MKPYDPWAALDAIQRATTTSAGECAVCEGTGECPECSPRVGASKRTRPCEECASTRRCGACEGSGRR